MRRAPLERPPRTSPTALRPVCDAAGSPTDGRRTPVSGTVEPRVRHASRPARRDARDCLPDVRARARTERRPGRSGSECAPDHAAGERLRASLAPSPRRLGNGSRDIRLAACPKGDALHRAARRLQLARRRASSRSRRRIRARAVKQLAARLDGRRLEGVEAVGKNLLLRFEGGLVLRSHLRMNGRWRVLRARRATCFGTPWLVLRGDEHAGVLWNGPVLELDRGAQTPARPGHPRRARRLDAMVAHLRAGRPGARDRRRAPRPAPRRRNREHVEGRGALGGARLAVARARRRRPTTSSAASLEAASRLMRAAARRCRGTSAASTAAGPAVSALRDADPVLAARRRRPHGVLVPASAREERNRRRRKRECVAVRAPHLLRVAPRLLPRRVPRAARASSSSGADLPFAFEEHAHLRPARRSTSTGRSSKPFVEHRAHALRRRPDAQLAVDELRREPAAAIFARAHAGPRADERRGALPQRPAPAADERPRRRAAASTGTTRAFDRAYGELELSLFGERPHVRGGRAADRDLRPAARRSSSARGIRVRAAATGELAKLWPEANGLLPADFGREPDRLCVLELERALEPATAEPPDAPGELADAVTAIRLATAGAVAAGPVLFERLDWRPYGIRPVLPIAATQPAGEPTRLDPFRGRLAARSARRARARRRRSGARRGARPLGALAVPGRPVPRGAAARVADALLGGTDGLWAAAVRGAILLGETPRARAELQERLSRRPRPRHRAARSRRGADAR